MILGAIWPDIVAFTVLLAILPITFEALTIWIMQNTEAVAVIVLEFAVVCLSIRPDVSSFTVFLACLEWSKVQSTIRPLVETLTTHSVVAERSLVHFTFRCDTASPPVDLSFGKETLEERIIWVDFEPVTIRSTALLILLASVFCARSTSIKVES